MKNCFKVAIEASKLHSGATFKYSAVLGFSRKLPKLHFYYRYKKDNYYYIETDFSQNMQLLPLSLIIKWLNATFNATLYLEPATIYATFIFQHPKKP